MKNKIRSFNQFKKVLEKDTSIQQQFKTDPLKAIEQFYSVPWSNDKFVYRLAVLSLAIIVFIICGGVIVLIWLGKISNQYEVPDILIATASTAIGAIAGLLTPNSNQQNDQS